MEPEYLSLFSNTGTVAVEVRFKNFDGSVRSQMMRPREISKLIGTDQNGFVARMSFDEHPMKLDKIEIIVEENRIVLHASPTNLQRDR